MTIEQGNLIGIHEATFTGCDQLEEITFNGTKAERLKIEVREYWTTNRMPVKCTDATVDESFLGHKPS